MDEISKSPYPPLRVRPSAARAARTPDFDIYVCWYLTPLRFTTPVNMGARASALGEISHTPFAPPKKQQGEGVKAEKGLRHGLSDCVVEGLWVDREVARV